MIYPASLKGFVSVHLTFYFYRRLVFWESGGDESENCSRKSLQKIKPLLKSSEN